jgi:hypothetical protein
MTPYYEHGGITIYHGDCREILPDVWFGVDLLLTDPPFPDYHVERFHYSSDLLTSLTLLPCRQFVFWSTRVDFPLSWEARHVWDKRKGGAGSAYEFVYERNGSAEQWVWPFVSIQNPVRAQFSRDDFTGHPSQKPWRLLAKIMSITKARTVLDPFMGSGSTLVAAKQCGRDAIGIEIEERYCEIAAKRLSQEVLPLELPA